MTYKNIFRLADGLLDANTRTGHVFISCLHLNPNIVENSKFALLKCGLKIVLSTLLMIRSHSGCYPFGDDGLTKHCAPHFTELHRYDKTEDYRLTAVLDRDHFQTPKIKWTRSKIFYLLLFFLIDPHHIHKWLDHFFDAWMNGYGNNGYELSYDPTKRRKTSYVTLWWIVLKHNWLSTNGRV
jgi:hypothetical protein